jgi:hypothetical protein
MTHYGRISKTLHILRPADEPGYRRQIKVQATRRVPRAETRLARTNIHGSRRAALGRAPLTLRIAGRTQPSRKDGDLTLRRLAPSRAQQPQEPEPAQEPIGVAPAGQWAAVAHGQVSQVRGHRLDFAAEAVDDDVRRAG